MSDQETHTTHNEIDVFMAWPGFGEHGFSEFAEPTPPETEISADVAEIPMAEGLILPVVSTEDAVAGFVQAAVRADIRSS